MPKQGNRPASPTWVAAQPGPAEAGSGVSGVTGALAHPLFRIGVVLLLGSLAYSNTLHVPFVFDDGKNIVDNPAVHGPGPPPFHLLRAFGLWTFAWNYAWGGAAVFGYHVVNLLIHLTSALLVYALAATTLRTLPGAGARVASPWLCALLFVCHPVQTQAVTYTVQRLASLATLFYLLAVLAYARARLAQARPRRLLLYLTALLAALLAVKTKEIAFTLPANLFLYELFFLRERRKRLAVWLGIVPFVVVAMLVPIALMEHTGVAHVANLETALHAGASRAIPRSDYLLTQSRVLVTYLRLLVLPIAQNLDYDYPVSHSLAEPRVLLSLLFLAGLLGAGLVTFLRSRQRSDTVAARGRLIAFGLLWFFVTLSVESSVVPLADVIFEHRLYLPSFGAFLVAACGFAALRDRLGARGRAARVAAGLAVVVLACASHARNAVWTDAGALWMDVLAKSPNSPRAHNNAANVYLMPRGRIDEAIAHYQTALHLLPEYPDAHNNLGLAYQRQGRFAEAAREYQAANLSPGYAAAHNNLGSLYLAQGRAEDAVREFLAYLRLAPRSAVAFYNLGLAYHRLARDDEALAALAQSVRLDERNADTHARLATMYLEHGRIAEAIPHLRAVVTLRPDDQVSRHVLEGLLRTGGNSGGE